MNIIGSRKFILFALIVWLIYPKALKKLNKPNKSLHLTHLSWASSEATNYAIVL